MRVLMSMILLASALPASAQVYKCLEGGRQVFSDTPCPQAESKMIDVRPAAGGPVNRSSEYWAERERREKAAAEREEAELRREVERRVRQQAAVAPPKALSAQEQTQLIERAKKAVLYKLIDPESGRFRNVSALGNEVCGEVNSKNRLGGYTGFQVFWVQFSPEPDVWMGDILGASAARVCAKRIAAAAASN